jgi:hypothetical protein
MKVKQEQLALPLECYASGELMIVTMGDAVARLHQANYGFLAPGNRITWHVDECQGWNELYEIAGEKPFSMGLHTYMYHGQPFTIDDAEVCINKRKELSTELFVAWAARFNRAFRVGNHGDVLPRELWPFRYVKTFANGNRAPMRPAYQMWDQRSSFVIAGVDRNTAEDSLVPNWSLLWRKFLRKLESRDC